MDRMVCPLLRLSKTEQSTDNGQQQGHSTRRLHVGIWAFNPLLCSWLLLSVLSELCQWAPVPREGLGLVLMG